MIEWKEIDNVAFWADEPERIVGYFMLDHSKSPKMWRLRFCKSDDTHVTVLRVAKGDLRDVYSMTYAKLCTVMHDIVLAAETFGLKPRGKPYRLVYDTKLIMKTSIAERL